MSARCTNLLPLRQGDGLSGAEALHPDGLHGALVWDAARSVRPPAPPHSLRLLESVPTPGARVAGGQLYCVLLSRAAHGNKPSQHVLEITRPPHACVASPGDPCQAFFRVSPASAREA